MARNTLEQAVRTILDSKLANLNIALPGRIETYDYKTQKATVKPLIIRKFKDGNVQSLPVLVNVPIIFPRTRKSGVTFPINKGDGVLLIFCHRSLERWYSSGDEVEPGDSRKFDLSDSVAIPGLFSFADSNIASNNTDVEIQNDGQKITITSDGDIKLGIGSLKKLVNDTFKTMFNNHVHNVSVAGTPAAQTGITSSPVKSVGTDPILAPPIPTTLYTIGEALGDNELTDKVIAQ